MLLVYYHFKFPFCTRKRVNTMNTGKNKHNIYNFEKKHVLTHTKTYTPNNIVAQHILASNVIGGHIVV